MSSGTVSLEDSSSWFEVNNATNGGKFMRLERTKTFFLPSACQLLGPPLGPPSVLEPQTGVAIFCGILLYAGVEAIRHVGDRKLILDCEGHAPLAELRWEWYTFP